MKVCQNNGKVAEDRRVSFMKRLFTKGREMEENVQAVEVLVCLAKVCGRIIMKESLMKKVGV